jgi:PAS domain-containing protein
MLQASIDVTGSITAASACWERLLGWPEQELLATPFIARVHPDDLETVISAIHHLHSGGTQVQFACRLVGKDRSFIWISWQARVHQDTSRIELRGNVPAVGRESSPSSAS